MPAGKYKIGLGQVGLGSKNLPPSTGFSPQLERLEAYEIDATEVTLSEYTTCVAAGGCTPPPTTRDPYCNWQKPDRQDHPINCVSYEQAESFCRWDGKRLPTEFEWEAAARASGAPRVPLEVFSTGPIAHACIRGENGHGVIEGLPGLLTGTCPVGHDDDAFARNGAHDLTGNVREYTAGHLCDYAHPQCKGRVVRGTSWTGHLYEEITTRWNAPGTFSSDVGIRCVRPANHTR